MVHGFPCFQNLTPDEAAQVGQHLRINRLSSGKALFRQGDHGDVVYLLLAGRLELTFEVAGSDPRKLASLGIGAILGDMSFLLSEPRTATATAETDAEVAHLDRAAFHAAVERGESWTQKFLLATAQTLARRLGMANRELSTMIAAAHGAPDSDSARKLETDLERLRAKLFSEWSF
ncbi:MAG: family transcriptional regulator, cyclic receptor protein [Chthoniobacter sp.]|nr:family transcriptional regulator, cyclic receptor protein [Chthoniobacter sp.]